MITFCISGLCSKSENVEPEENQAAALRVIFRALDLASFDSTFCFNMFSGAGRMACKGYKYGMVQYSTV